jgi:hypothetical protein
VADELRAVETHRSHPFQTLSKKFGGFLRIFEAVGVGTSELLNYRWAARPTNYLIQLSGE